MPSLRLIPPLDADDQPTPDQYGFRARFQHASVETLIAAYNSGVNSRGWVRARAMYLVALREALLASGYDCSSFISTRGMNLDAAVTLREREIVPTRTA